MGSYKAIVIKMLIMLPIWSISAEIDCDTVTGLFSSCATFVTYGSPDPTPGSPCCDAMTSLELIADTTDNRRSVCRCLMGLISTYNPNATAIATLPGFCGISLGFTIDPNTDCNYESDLRKLTLFAISWQHPVNGNYRRGIQDKEVYMGLGRSNNVVFSCKENETARDSISPRFVRETSILT